MDNLTRRSLSGLLGVVLVLGAFIFLPAWTAAFWQGWLYWLIAAGSLLFITAYFLKTDPALVERRLKAGPAAEQEHSQRIIQSLALVVLWSLLIVPGLDHHFSWSTVPVVAILGGDALVVLGFLVIFVVFKKNTYTAGTVQVAPNQTVISTGPYGVVRHPMYGGALSLFLGTPLALGSWWALLAVIPMAAILISRLLNEERFLARNLAGYTDYCARVRRHLIPLVW